MPKSFLTETKETSTPAVPLAAPTEPTPGKRPIRILVISSREGVLSTIRSLHSLGFAEVNQWSPLLPAPNSGEVVSILTRYLLTDS